MRKGIDMENEILVCLDHDDFVNLVTSVAPDFKYMKELIDEGLCSWTGGFVDKFNWKRSALEKLDIEELYHIYFYIKSSKEQQN